MKAMTRSIVHAAVDDCCYQHGDCLVVSRPVFVD
jgi:hypothetical protein